jgi:hypothetical protein
MSMSEVRYVEHLQPVLWGMLYGMLSVPYPGYPIFLLTLNPLYIISSPITSKDAAEVQGGHMKMDLIL